MGKDCKGGGRRVVGMGEAREERDVTAAGDGLLLLGAAVGLGCVEGATRAVCVHWHAAEREVKTLVKAQAQVEAHAVHGRAAADKA